MENRVLITTEFNKTVSFSMYHTCTGVIRSIKIVNDSEAEYGELKIRVSFTPDFASEVETLIPTLAPAEKVEIASLAVPLNFTYLSSLTEAENASMKVALYNGEEEIASDEQSVQLLAYNEWRGDDYLSELLASFVMPNHPAVRNLLPVCGKFLEQWCGNPAITGYMSKNPNEVRKQVAAAYEALRAEAVAYIVPPASYRSGSQKIRTVDEVLTNKQGTCLDLSVLLASLLEAMGLHPIIVLEKSHAYVGCWLSESMFTNCVQDDCTALGKRVAEGIDEIVLFEATFATAGQEAGFEAAVLRGLENLKKEENFEEAIDIARCRGCGIYPLPAKVTENGEVRLVEYDGPKGKVREPEDLSRTGVVTEVEQNVMTKQKLWERKLLDLSLRNPLLNFRVNKSVVQLMTPSLARLEDELSDGEVFNISEVPAESKFTPGEDKIYDLDGEFSEWAKVNSESEFSNKRIRTFLQGKDLENSMKYLSRQAKLSLEENGSNTLYLAEGFLKWYEEGTNKERFAPLILIPVDITKKLQEKTYKIKVRDEEAQFNVTLLEFLRQDFGMDIGGLDPLPNDEHGINIPLILNTLRQSVMEKEHWDVKEYCFLGIFSFSRFIMWNDLKNRSDEILSNKVVKSLIEGRMTWDSPIKESDFDNPDERLKPSDMAVVMSADSSQLVAIETAAKGESFVLHGPPGSGKSQTITNMIANALYQGKSVLFVAEKMAALSVVQNRLAKVGLDPFCLELHSNKAQKSAVFAQLAKTLEVSNLESPAEYEAIASKLYEQRSRLNEIVNELHAKRHNGFSVYELIGMYETNASTDGKVSFTGEWAANISPEQFDKCRVLLSDYATVSKECGDISAHPLKSFRFSDYSMQMREDWEKELCEYREILESEQKIIPSFSGSLINDTVLSVSELMWLENVLSVSSKMQGILPALIEGNDAEVRKDYIESRIKAGIEYMNAKAALLSVFKPTVLAYDVAAARQRLIAAQGKWLLSRKKEVSSLVKELAFQAVNPTAVTEDKLESLYQQIENFKAVSSACGTDEKFAGEFAGLYNGENTDWNALAAAYNANRELCLAISSGNVSDEIRKTLTGHISDGSFVGFLTSNAQTLNEFLSLRIKGLGFENSLITKYGLNWNDFFEADDFISAMIESIDKWIANKEEMRSYAAFCIKEKELCDAGIGDIVVEFRNGTLESGCFESAFRCAFGKSAATNYISSNPVLAHFNGAGFNATIDNFREVSEQFEILSVKETVAKLSANIPRSGEGISSSSEVGILQKQIKNPRRAMPIRKLFNEIPTLLRRMCPCMLMSPISVAQYIDPSFPKFDLVIFDEASQIPTGEAVGALARGENVIVVGDPKQLPPTTFFMNNRQDEENLEVEDMESLLDDCLAISMPEQHLLWHYRSRHESLIAYSNMAYYDNKLLSFPSPNDLISQVKLIEVDGFYDRGKTKQNQAEAEQIVAEILARLKDPARCHDTIGVVTFSVVQQNLIDDMLAEALSKDDAAARASLELEEPIFIKNLENVQGDERDVILFSVGYGPDKDGKVGMNFGPLNQEGGWRRLNVAISRSRKEMLIYSTLRPEQINSERTTAEGVLGLKGFLEFAAKGKNAFYVRNESKTVRNSDVAKAITAELTKEGYKANCDIGSSEFKIDIGIINPENPDEYCLGILIDGENYYSAKTARDRNILQPSVLEGLGWRIHRVWTLDWFDTPERELGKIKERIETAVAEIREEKEKAEQALLEAERKAAEADGSEAESSENESNENESKETEGNEAVGNETEGNEEESGEVDTVVNGADSTLGYMSLKKAEVNTVKSDYVFFKRNALGEPDDFKAMSNNIQITKVAGFIIDTEAPISKNYLKKRIVSFWGITRITPKVDERLEEALSGISFYTTQCGGEEFYWKSEEDSRSYGIYRCSKADDEISKSGLRLLCEVAPEEAVNAVVEIVKNNISLDWEDVIDTLAKTLGCPKADAAGERLANAAISMAEQRGEITVSDDGTRVSSGK